MSLNTQLGFLEQSCKAFDEGHKDEGLRIAAVLRTLFKDAGRSVSVLTHLQDAGHTVGQILSSGKPVTDLTVNSGSALSIAEIDVHPIIYYDDNGVRGTSAEIYGEYVPTFASFPESHSWVSRDDWWQQVIYAQDGEPITRRGLVLAAAEQDGGVHVDAQLNAAYRLLREGAISVVLKGGQMVKVTNPHLADLRQMAYEVLSSPDLQALRKRPA